jgi:septal ring factor EnvC (AmiA/AmiB activator)
MPTPEERLTTLEYNLDQFKAEATSYYQEMALQVTMTKGLTEDAVKRLMQLRVQVDKRFNSTDQQLAEVKQEVAGVKQEVAEVKQELAGVRQVVAGVQTTLAQILARLPEKP